MKHLNVLFLSAILLAASEVVANPSTDKFRIFKKAKTEKSKVDTTLLTKSSDYDKLTKDAAKCEGLFTTFFTKENKLYFEINDSLFSEQFILSNRIASTSNPGDYSAGEMVTDPFVVEFTKDQKSVYMHKVDMGNYADPSDPMYSAFKKNNLAPIVRGFEIKAKTDSTVVIDVTKFFGTNEASISPLKPDNPLAKLFGGGNSIKGAFVADASAIQQVKSFPCNVEVKSLLSFNTQPLNRPYSVVSHRSIVLLPKEPMATRLQDNRVGFFSEYKKYYSTDKDRLESFEIINRWRLEPKPEDRELYFAGELVEPIKPIVFYVDSAFPEKWRATIKQGIEDWNTAFESAGFKNAIKALDYPKNDSVFDPDDMRFSCIKYAATPTANAMGPSHVDPRTGEILTADVIWYHNITSLLHNWRFTQTAAVDPRVRTERFSDDVMNESIRYVIAHEVGHTLGLMHNMGASYSFPVDSLRSSSFTQKYGTTPSIMDYARNNFIAQPGDMERGVRLTPPVLGVYDIFAINWGYRIIPNNPTMQEEKKVLTEWIASKADDPMYEFGAQQFFGTIDPTDQTEDLGDDHLKAGDLAVENLKITTDSLLVWLYNEDERYDNLQEVYQQIVKQYKRHVYHVMPYIGGVEFKEVRQGDGLSGKSYFDKKEQKAAMLWLLDQARTYESWLSKTALLNQLELPLDANAVLAPAIVVSLYNPSSLYRIKEGEMLDATKNYTLTGYIDDVTAEVFKNTIAGNPLNATEQSMQAIAIALMGKYSGLSASKSSKASSLAFNSYNLWMDEALAPSLPCSHSHHAHEGCCGAAHQAEGEDSFYRINFGMPSLSSTVVAPIMITKLKYIESIYKSRRNTARDADTKAFYNYQLLIIENLFEKAAFAG